MKNILLLTLILTTLLSTGNFANASLISDRAYRISQNKEIHNSEKQIRKVLKIHNIFANKHDLEALKSLYADNYMNNDGFNKNIYFESIQETWTSCKDLTYTTDILSVKIDGDYASVHVKETATGTISDTIEETQIAGEIHSKSTGIYHFQKINGNWYISGETSLTDESSLLYGDARFLNIEIQAPTQVFSGDTYVTTVKVDGGSNTYIVGSIDRDIVTYPASTPKSTLRAFPQSNILERYLKANTKNTNEYTIASLALSKFDEKNPRTKLYMSGLACVMKRINVIPKNELARESTATNNKINVTNLKKVKGK